MVFELQLKVPCAKETKYIFIRLSTKANNKNFKKFRRRFISDTFVKKILLAKRSII